MTDILIRDWSVPKGCGVCPLNTGAFYCAGLKRYVIEEEHVWMGSNYRRLKDCPLNELPEHGDLIDRNANVAVIKKVMKASEGIERHMAEATLKVLNAAPVVLPSNKEETE